MKPYFDRDGIVIYHADCREILPGLEGVDAVVTDPPYGIVNEFGEHNGRPGHGSRSMQFAWDDSSVIGCVRDAVLAATTEAKAAFVFCGFDTIGPVQDALRERGFTPKPWVWVKTCPPPPLPGNWWPSGFEIAVYAYRSGAWFGDTNPKRRNVYVGDTLRHGNLEKCGHPTQKPLHIMEHIVGSIVPPGGLCLDVFGGSMTTGVAAWRLGRRCILCEISEEYCEIGANRLNREMDQGRLFSPRELAAQQKEMFP